MPKTEPIASPTGEPVRLGGAIGPIKLPHLVGWEHCNPGETCEAAVRAIEVLRKAGHGTNRGAKLDCSTEILESMRQDLRGHLLRAAVVGIRLFPQDERYSLDRNHEDRGSMSTGGQKIIDGVPFFWPSVAALSAIDINLVSRGMAAKLFGRDLLESAKISGFSHSFHSKYSKIFGELAPKADGPRSYREIGGLEDGTATQLKAASDAILDMMTLWRKDRWGVAQHKSCGLVVYYLGCCSDVLFRRLTNHS